MWQPIATIPRDGKSYVVGRFKAPQGFDIVYWATDKGARDMPLRWCSELNPCEYERDAIMMVYTHWCLPPNAS